MKRPQVAKEDLLRSQTTIMAGLVFAALTFAFLMWLVIGIEQIQCSKTALIALVFGLGVALSTSFIGGYASARGPVSIPYLGGKPIGVALGGGILALLITTGMAWYVVKNSCVEVAAGCDPRLPAGTTRISCGEVHSLKDPPEGDGFLAVRAGPTTSCAKMYDLHNGDLVEIRVVQDPWLHVRRVNKPPFVEGWAFKDYIRKAECLPDAPAK